jgi:Mu-like prophage I protein
MVTANFLVDAAGLQFSDATALSTWIHALPLGAYKHPVYGTVDITTDRAAKFVESVKTKIRGIEPSINYEHDNSSGAAGWVKDAESRSDGVWLFVDFVPDAAAAVKDKKWRYFSAEFMDEWTDPQGVKHNDVIVGGALSNRPFMKNLVPINLAESTYDTAFELVSIISGQPVDSLKGGSNVDLSDEQIDKIVTKLAEKLSPTPPTPPTPQMPKLSDIPELKSLAEENPMVKALIEHVESQNVNLAESAKRLKEAEVERQLAEFDRSKIVLTPTARQRVVNIMNQMPTELSEEFFQLMQDMKKSSAFLVELGERAGTTVNYGSPKSAAKQFEDAAAKLMSEAKINYTEAVERVASENPALYRRYRSEQFEGATR